MKFFIIIIFVFLLNNPSKALEEDKAYFAGGCFWCVEESFEKLNGVIEVISGYSGGTTENPTYKEVTYGNTGHFEVVEIIYDKKIISFQELLENFWVNIDPFDAYGQFCDKGYSYRSVAFYQNDVEKKLIENDVKDLENRFNKKVISFEELLENFWVNIDPFDAYGQFCDKGYSYRSVAFYQNEEEKKLIEKDIKDLQNKFNKKVVTYIRNFEKFYKAEEYHQDFYKIKLERYLRYKKACGREELLKRIWSQ